MKSPKHEKKNDDFKISRFLSKDTLLMTLGLKRNPQPTIISELHPTFYLGSLESYRYLEDTDPRKDTHENIVETYHPESGVALSNVNLNPILAACWSMHQESELLDETFSAFKTADAVIISTVGEVNKLLSQAFVLSSKEKKVDIRSGCVVAAFTDHGTVYYYSQRDHEKTNRDLNKSNNCFFKRASFQHENEYRFAVVFDNYDCHPNAYSFVHSNVDYIKKIYLKERRFTEKEIELINMFYSERVIFIKDKSSIEQPA